MSAFIPTTLPLPRSLPSSNRQTPRCAVDTEAPPVKRYSKYYPAPCFEAPHISLFNADGVELMNKIGVLRQEVALDLDLASQLLAQARAIQAKKEDGPSVIFTGPVIDPMTSDPSDKYYPSFRRDEAPVIEITPPTTPSDGEVLISLGSVVATPPSDDVQPRLPGPLIGTCWNEPPPASADPIIDTLYPKSRRYLAPVIDIPQGALAVSVEMKKILGECEADLYPQETRFMAPKIEMKPPKGDWDSSAFVNLSMEEIQLPVIAAAVLKV